MTIFQIFAFNPFPSGKIKNCGKWNEFSLENIKVFNLSITFYFSFEIPSKKLHVKNPLITDNDFFIGFYFDKTTL